MSGLKISLLIVLIITEIESARILAYFPTPSISHQVVFRPIIKELARRGHEITLVTTDPILSKEKKGLGNIIEIDVHDISYKSWEEFLKYKRGKREDLWNELELLFKRMTLIFEMQMQVPDVKQIMNRDRKYFDLLLIEACHRPVLGLIHKFDAPAIQISSFGGLFDHYDSMGAPTHLLLYPTPINRRLYNLTLIEKGLEVYGNILFNYLMSVIEEFDYTILKNIFGDDIPPYRELQKRVKMIILNEHPFWADNRPVPPNIIYMGGIHQNTPKELPKEIKEYMDSSKNGVIYVSFGTNVLPSLLPPERIKVMTKVLSQLPYDVLWKWDREVLPGQSSNIKISKWFPQADLLKHPKLKLFITQGGLQSTDEAIDAAVPLIGIPMLGDQWYNVEKYTHHNIGIQFEIGQITETNFKQAIITMIEDKSYKNNMLTLRSRMREYPIKPIYLAAEWAEYIIKHGGDHLKSPAVGISWIDYYEIKLVLIILGIIFIILGIFVYILKLIFGFLIKICKNKIKLKKY